MRGAARSTVLKDSDVVMLIGARTELAAVARQGQDLGRCAEEIHPDRHRAEGNGFHVEIVAPVVGDIGSCVSALLTGMGGNWPAPPSDWILRRQQKARRGTSPRWRRG